MTTETFADVRQALSAQILTIGGDWNASPVPYALHGPDDVPDAVPATVAHLSFAIGLESERYDDRQKTHGTWTQSDASVRWFARYTPKDGIASEDAAYGHENDLITAVVATATLQVLWARSARSMVSSGEWFANETTFSVLHRTPLT